MSRPIVLTVVSDTKSAAAGVKDLSASFEPLVQQLKDLGPDGQQAADELESSMKAAQLATQDASSATKQLVDSVNKAKLAAAEGGLDLSAGLQKTAQAAQPAAAGMRQVSEEGGKLKEGLMMNAGFGVPMLAEALGSGEGGLAGAATAAGQAIGGMGMMMGPEVMVPAAAFGALLSFLGVQLQQTAEEEKTVTSITADLAAAWEKAHPAGDAFSKAIAEWVANSKDYGIDLTNLRDDANAIGASFGDITLAMVAKSIPAMEQQKKTLAELTEKYAEQEHELGANGGANSKEMQQLASKEGAIKTVTKALDEQIKAAKDAKAAEEAQAATLGLSVTQYEKYSKSVDQLTKTVKTDKSAVDSFRSSLQSDLQSTGSQLDQILDRSKTDAAAIISNQQKTLEANKRFLSDWNTAVKEGLDANGQAYVEQNRADFQEVVDTYGINSPQSKQFIANANSLGSQTGTSFTDQFTSGVSDALVRAQDILRAKKLDPQLDLSGSYAQVNALVDYINNQKPEVFVNVKGSGPLGSRIG